MNPITTIPEAKRVLAEIADASVRLQAFLNNWESAIGRLSGKDQSEIPDSSERGLPKGIRGKALKRQPDSTQETEVGRVLTIMREADDRPMAVKEIVERRRARKWPEPESYASPESGDALYVRVHGTIGYLHKSGTLERKKRGVYALASQSSTTLDFGGVAVKFSRQFQPYFYDKPMDLLAADFRSE